MSDRKIPPADWGPDGRVEWLMHDFGGDLEVVPAGPRWQSRAACLGMPVDVFFPEGKGSGPGEALKVCADCPVQVECREWAEAEGFPYGVFGGQTERQRRTAQRAAEAA